MFSGFEQWKQYNAIIGEVIRILKTLKQQVFVLGIPENKDVEFGEVRKYLKVKGKELKFGFVEKEFTIVLFTRPIYDEDAGEMEDVLFQYRPNKKNTAKSPIGMFEGQIKNDALEVAKQIRKYYEEYNKEFSDDTTGEEATPETTTN
jgi:hypothetical protein